jgi:predicted  nucleic acid-binding Zn-ribbon protein
MTNENDSVASQKQRGFWHTVRAILKALLQLILILAFGALLGAGLYYAIPWLYRATVVPVQENTASIVALDRRVSLAEVNIETRTEALQERNAQLEGELTELQETVAVQERAMATAAAQLATIQPGLSELQATYDSQATDMADIETALERVMREQTTQRSQLDTQETDLANLEELLDTATADSAETMEAIADDQREALGRLALLQAAQDLLRVRLQLLEDNPGAAQASLNIVVEHLTHATVWWPDITDQAAQWAAQTEALGELIGARSFRATPTLESLWADIAASVLPPLPEDAVSLSTLSETADLTTTLTTTVTATTTISPSDTLTVTPTVTATATAPPPTPTPWVTRTPLPTPTPTE